MVVGNDQTTTWQTVFPDSGIAEPLFGPEGPDWQSHSLDGVYANLTAEIPSDILSNLMRTGIIGDPYFSRNFLTQRHVWMGPLDKNPYDGPRLERWSRTWVYTTEFMTHGCLCDDRSTVLVLEGIKMGTTISLNGAHLGNVTDQFLWYEFALDRVILERGSAVLSTIDDSITAARRLWSSAPAVYCL